MVAPPESALGARTAFSAHRSRLRPNVGTERRSSVGNEAHRSASRWYLDRTRVSVAVSDGVVRRFWNGVRDPVPSAIEVVTPVAVVALRSVIARARPVVRSARGCSWCLILTGRTCPPRSSRSAPAGRDECVHNDWPLSARWRWCGDDPGCCSRRRAAQEGVNVSGRVVTARNPPRNVGHGAPRSRGFPIASRSRRDPSTLSVRASS